MSKNVIEKELRPEEVAKGIKRRYIPVTSVINELEALKDPKMWKAAGAGGQDQYAGMPPAIRIIDTLIAELNS